MKSSSFSPFTKWLLVPVLLIFAVAAGFFIYRFYKGTPSRTRLLISWIRYPSKHPDWINQAHSRCLESTPFQFPTEGYIGFIWGDSFRPGHRHQGIDIFSKESTGETPVYAAYSGFLTRLPDWKSSLIIRIPRDPLNSDRQVWTYYTHMADAGGDSYIVDDFPPGTSDVFVEEGTLLGYQGNYSGTPGNPVGIHLHFSIVKDDEDGTFLNELKFQNTLDPSPYFDLPLNAQTNQDTIPICQ